jgi:hypothetical protein
MFAAALLAVPDPNARPAETFVDAEVVTVASRAIPVPDATLDEAKTVPTASCAEPVPDAKPTDAEMPG